LFLSIRNVALLSSLIEVPGQTGKVLGVNHPVFIKVSVNIKPGLPG
jgi:hypothetical protein